MNNDALLFIIIAVIAVVSAGAMLVTHNAIHSALFLIINFGCIAFLFLMLNAPFLAMVQITVYTGAIMVLFLFVIMLLGVEDAEKALREERTFRWLTPLAVFLAVLFLLTAGWGLTSGRIETQEPPSGQPMLRVVQVHAPTNPFGMDVFVDGKQVGTNLEFRDTTDFMTLAPGDHTVTLNPTGTQATLSSTTVTLKAGDVRTLVVYGDKSLPAVATVADDLSELPDRTGRVVFFNAYSQAPTASLVDLGANKQYDADQDVVLVNNLQPGKLAEPVEMPEGMTDLAVIAPDGSMVIRMRDFKIVRGVDDLIIGAEERLLDGTQRAVVLPLTTKVMATFGGPQAVGQLLFSRYLLPFEMVAVLLLASMIGAIVISQRAVALVPARRLGRRKVSRPLTAVVTAQTGHELGEEPVKQLPGEQSEPAGD